jgi:hypothetical protein
MSAHDQPQVRARRSDPLDEIARLERVRLRLRSSSSAVRPQVSDLSDTAIERAVGARAGRPHPSTPPHPLDATRVLSIDGTVADCVRAQGSPWVTQSDGNGPRSTGTAISSAKRRPARRRMTAIVSWCSRILHRLVDAAQRSATGSMRWLHASAVAVVQWTRTAANRARSGLGVWLRNRQEPPARIQ